MVSLWQRSSYFDDHRHDVTSEHRAQAGDDLGDRGNDGLAVRAAATWAIHRVRHGSALTPTLLHVSGYVR